MHIAEVVTIAKSLPLLRLNTYKSLILSYSADYRRIFRKKYECHMDDGTLKAIIEFYACLRSSDIWRKKGRSKGQK